MRKTILALTLAAGALGVASSASQAGYGGGGYGYGGGYRGYYKPHYYRSYYAPCHWIKKRVWSDYYYRYIYVNKKVCY